MEEDYGDCTGGWRIVHGRAGRNGVSGGFTHKMYRTQETSLMHQPEDDHLLAHTGTSISARKEAVAHAALWVEESVVILRLGST